MGPLVVLALSVLACVALLSVPISVPLGPNYWDLPVYLDGAHRIALGQVPGIDFHAPVGALGYYLVFWAERLFPLGQSLLLVQFSLLAVTVPLMALVLIDLRKQPKIIGFALILPFLLFSVLPFNTQAYSTYPGVDGYGIYNRQVCVLLYVLVSALLFVSNRNVKPSSSQP